MIAESELIKTEIILRGLALPQEVLLTRASTLRWLALSLGLINPNESRTIIIDLLDALLHFHYANKRPTTQDLVGKLSEKGLSEKNIKAIYYHLDRLRQLGLISREKGEYFFGDGSTGDLAEVFKRIYEERSAIVFKNIGRALSRIEKG